MTNRKEGRSNRFKSFVHFRRLREMFADLCEKNNVIGEHYDMFHMAVYQTVGESFESNNVIKNISAGGNGSIFVQNNIYFVAECPNKRNRKGSEYGNFLCIAYNYDYGYYTFFEMTVDTDSNGNTYSKINPYCEFKNINRENVISRSGYNINKGFISRNRRQNIFDFYGDRSNSYKTSNLNIHASNMRQKDKKETKIFSDKKVRKYRRQ